MAELFALFVYLGAIVAAKGTESCNCTALQQWVHWQVRSVTDQGYSFSRRIRALEEGLEKLNDLRDDVRALNNTLELQKPPNSEEMIQNATAHFQDEFSQNVTSTVALTESLVRSFGEEVAENMKTMEKKLERERELRKALEKEVAELRGFNGRVDKLLSEREEIRNQLADVREASTALENSVSLLETKTNETEELWTETEVLWSRMEALEDNVSTEKIREIIEMKLGERCNSTDHGLLEQRLDGLEYKVKVQQELILGDDVGNFGGNVSLSIRVERLEKILNGRNDTEEPVGTVQDQVNNSVVDEITLSLNTVKNESRLLASRIDDVRCLNVSIAAKQAAHSAELNRTLSDEAILELKETIQELNRSVQEQKVQSEQQIATLKELLNETMEVYANGTAEIRGGFLKWELRLNECTADLIAEFNETKEMAEDLMRAKKEQVHQVREELDTLAAIVKELQQDLDSYFFGVSSNLSRISEELAEKAPFSKVQKMDTSVRTTSEEVRRLTDRLILISINVSSLRGQMEDNRRKHISLNNNITEAKQWAALYVDNKKNEVEKQLKKLEERLYRDTNSTIHSQLSSCRCVADETKYSSDSQSESPGTPCPGLTVGEHVVIRGVPRSDVVSFHCRHIGRYLLKGHSTIRCEHGRWNGSVPKCVKLPDEDDIDDVKYKRFTCPSASGKYKYPLDCSVYYDCSSNIPSLLSCQAKSRFDSVTRSCVDPSLSDCDDAPAIHVVPELGSPDSPLQVSRDGSLVVFPGVDLQLHCIRGIEEGVDWIIHRGEVKHILLSGPYGDKVTVTKLESVTEKNSGTYSCITENGKTHSIRIIVKAYECPPIKVHPPLHSSSNSSQMYPAAEVEFFCDENYRLIGSSLLTCRANGDWSDKIPSCFPIGCLRPNTANDPWIQLDPDQEIYNITSKVTLTCSEGAPRYSIPASVKCRDNGQWQQFKGYPSFPTCHRRFKSPPV